ncbi:vascular endothelial growth factor A-like isoform X2 [Pogonomyrmex barbatus]|uniref:Vascular endothelial growth factor A-like isoform X2 n=1 Tax=Pogonomyrmex barbatus TaxID=144034 RepID=A0A8N1S4I1_9HYME|nr:vascular endothelial growth factor A-like isoform X2 [Pogonomyrmex barbatus]
MIREVESQNRLKKLMKMDSDFLSHVQLVHQFQCLSPQPRAISVEDLLTVGLGSDEVFYPAFTVLTRCVGSGCCPDSNQICAPIETRNVSLVFMVRHRIDQQRDRHHEVIHALEHVKCACMNKIYEDLQVSEEKGLKKQ